MAEPKRVTNLDGLRRDLELAQQQQRALRKKDEATAESVASVAQELRELAYQEVNADVDEVKEKLGKLSDEVKGIGDGLANATGILRLVVGLLKK